MDSKNNTGKENSGCGNSGNWNSGDGNSGDGNSGDGNSGDGNSGDGNSGYGNSGNWNSGYENSGNGNSGNWNSGCFNTDEPPARLFNKFTDKKKSEIEIPYIELPVTEWIPEDQMTDEQKKNDPDFHIRGGQLIKRDYKEAWAIAWGKADKELRQRFLDLPNFDADIFFEITGIDVREEQRPSVKL